MKVKQVATGFVLAVCGGPLKQSSHQGVMLRWVRSGSDHFVSPVPHPPLHCVPWADLTSVPGPHSQGVACVRAAWCQERAGAEPFPLLATRQ